MIHPESFSQQEQSGNLNRRRKELATKFKNTIQLFERCRIAQNFVEPEMMARTAYVKKGTVSSVKRKRQSGPGEPAFNIYGSRQVLKEHAHTSPS